MGDEIGISSKVCDNGRRDRHLGKVVARSVEEDPHLGRAEEEHKRKLVEIENDDAPRGSETEREVQRRNQDAQPDHNMDYPNDDVRGTKRMTEKKGEHGDVKERHP